MQNQPVMQSLTMAVGSVDAVELCKTSTEHVTGNTEPAKVQLHLMLETCSAIVYTELNQLVAKSVSKTGWS